MNINSDYSADDTQDKGSVELTNMALDAVENNIINKVSDHLQLIDCVGFASVRVILEEVARKAQAYEAMTENKKHFERN